MSRYIIKRTYVQAPWRYMVYERFYPVALTFTKWGAERVVRKMKRQYGDED